jgi:hypothetical protein
LHQREVHAIALDMMCFRIFMVILIATAFFIPAGCGGTTESDVSQDTAPPPRPKGLLGEMCREHEDCVSNFCLESEYGPPFCTRPCDTPQESCPAGPDAEEKDSLCVSYAEETLAQLGLVDTPTFKGAVKQFCVRKCAQPEECKANNLNWEVCANPKFLGLPIHPSLGQIRVCQAPSYHGKDPVDPALCNWEKTVLPLFASEANLCRKYCAYLQTCQEIAVDALMNCCEWGCFNQLIDASIPEVNDLWYDEIKCFIDNHAAYPPVGQANFCSEPPKQCPEKDNPHPPTDPTPPAASW